MEITKLQNLINLIATSDPKKIHGNDNTILSSRLVLETVGAIEVLASKMSDRGIKHTDELFEIYDNSPKLDE